MNLRALVTGAARGVGAAITRSLTAADYDVVGVDLTAGADLRACDVSDATAVASLADEIGPIDLLVNNAATWRFGPLEELAPDEFVQVLRVNLIGAFHCIRHFAPAMLEAGRGSIVNVVSVAACQPNTNVGGYAASKAGLVALTAQAALEWGGRGVRCNAVAPGFVHTPGTGDVYGDDERRSRRAQAVPQGRVGTADEIADAVAFLASESAAYINGEVLHVDGGLSKAALTLASR